MQEKYYLKIDECPLKAWRKANEHDFTHLRKGKQGNETDDFKAWELLYNDFIRVIGLTPEFEQYLQLIKDKIEAIKQYLNSVKNGMRDRFLLNRINILDGQIQQFNQTGGKGLTIAEILPKLSKMQGYHIKETEITVLDYFNLLKEYQNG